IIVIAEAIALTAADLHHGIAIAELHAGLRRGTELTETAAFQQGRDTRRRGAGRRDEIERAAQYGGAQAVGGVAAVDFDLSGLARIGKADNVRTIRLVD